MNVPAKLGELVLRERLGEGGYGTAYRAEDPELGRDAVVKVLHRRVDDAVGRERFLAEVRLAARLDHPYAAHVYAFGVEADGLAWIAMERVRGTPLDAMLASTGRLPPERLLPLIDRLCEVVQSAHEQGIVHRDLKPANVMVLSRAGRLLPKLLDLGVARGEARQGTPLYMAPEQWTVGEVDGRADVYALGVLVYECLAGVPPFDGKSWFAVARAHARKPPPALPPDLPAALDAVLARALAKRPDDRFATAGELAAALRVAAGLDGARTRPPRLAEAVREAWAARAPQPLAEGVAALDAAQNPHQAGLAARALIAAACRWVGLLALAASAAMGRRVPARVRELVRRELGDGEWLELAREATAPFVDRPAAHPVPELVGLAVTPPVIALEGGDEEEVRARLAAGLEELAVFLRGLDFLLGYTLVRPVAGVVERWSGPRQTPRAPAELSAAAAARLPAGQAAVVDAEGAPVVPLWPMVQVAAPAPGAAEEVFLLAGPGRHGARLIAAPGGFERQDAELWAWLRAHLDETVGGGAAPEETERPPYLGLRPFTAGEAGLYVGREREAQAFVNRLRVTPLLAVVGPSGAGKSSFVHAGVGPVLPEGWSVATMRPGPRPLPALQHALTALSDPRDKSLPPPQPPGAGSRILVVDQLEELFTLGASPDDRGDFAAALAGAIDAGTRVVVTLRDDFLMRAQALPSVGERLAQGLVLLATPAEDDLRRIVVEPARRVGYDFDDPELPREMARAVAERPGALALLSFTAARLWELRDRGFRRLSRRAYDGLGGVAGALAEHAERTLAELPPDLRALVRQAFRRLVTAEGTRAIMRRADLAHVLGARGDQVLERLIEARLLVATETETGDEQIEIIHEALLDAWPRLAAWRREDEHGTRLRAQLGSAAGNWNDRGRAAGLLWRDEALAELGRWRRSSAEPLTALEEAFASASLADAARGRRRRRALVGGAFVALAAGIAVLAQMNARTAASERDAQRRLGQLYEEQGRQSLLAGQPNQALVYLVEAQRLARRTPVGQYLIAEAFRVLRARLATFSGHRRVIWFLAFSPDGGRLVTASNDATARVWDAGGRELTVLRHEAPVQTARFSPDGRRVATASSDHTAVIWDTGGARLQTLRHQDSVLNALWSPDGSRLLTVSWDHTAALWDTATGARVATLRHEEKLHAAAFSPDGKRVLTGGYDGKVSSFDLDGHGLFTVQAHAGLVWSVSYSRDGTRFASAGDDATAAVWDARSGALVRRLQGHTDQVYGAELSLDGAAALTASADHHGRIWNLSDGSYVDLDHPGLVWTASFSPDGKQIVTACGDGIARLFDRQGVEISQLAGHDDQVRQAVFDPSGQRVAAAIFDGTATLWTARPVSLLLEPPARDATVASFAPDGGRIASWDGDDHAIHVWDAADGSARAVFPGSDERTLIAWSGDGRRLARGHGATVDLLDEAGAVIATGDAGGRILGLAFLGERVVTAGEGGVRLGSRVLDDKPARCIEVSPDGGTLAACGEGTIRFYDRDGAPRPALAVQTRVTHALAFDPSGRRILVAGRENVARIYGLDGRQQTTLEGQGSEILHVAFSPDGTRVATGSFGGNVRIWDPDSGKVLRVFNHGGEISAVAFSPDGKRLLTASARDRVKIWDISVDERTPAELAATVRCLAPFQLVGGLALPRVIDDRCAATGSTPNSTP